MNFYLYSPIYFEKWDFRNSVEKGIGGSETSHVEMAWRLAARGHKVTTYAPIPDDCPTEWRGTKWLPLEAATFKEPGVWIIYRSPDTVEKFAPKEERKNQKVWLLMQDWDYPNWTNKRVAACDAVIAMCKWHARQMVSNYPAAKDLLWLNSNGLKLDLIAETEKLNIKRDPNLILYPSSPDRGLKPLLISFKKAKEYLPDLRLKVTYGFDNIDKLIEQNPKSYYISLKKELLELADQPGVEMLGRVTQPELYKLWFEAGIWVYQTTFAETSCISCMEAQAMGAIPVFSPVWAQGENVKHGVPIPGDPSDPLTNARFAAEIVRMAAYPSLQDQIRKEMMPWARERYDWERMVDLWEYKAGVKKDYPYEYPEDMTDDDYEPYMEIKTFGQAVYQLTNVKGKILNIGCDTDDLNLKALGATNVDILAENPNGKVNKVDLIADARNLPKSLYNQFDTALLGDILEHMSDADIIKSLKSAKKCLKSDGYIIVTCPNDYRPRKSQRDDINLKDYTQGISSYHDRPIPKGLLVGLIEKADLKVKNYAILDYSFCKGHGIICY